MKWILVSIIVLATTAGEVLQARRDEAPRRDS